MIPAHPVIVTGGGAGIGEAVVDLLLERGHRCVVLDRHPVIGRDPGQVLALTCDVSDPVAVDAALERAFAWAPDAAGLVNCAGYSAAVPSLLITPQEWRAVFATNLDGTLFTTQSFVRRLADASPAAVVNLGSVAGQFGWPGRLAYSSAKAAIEALTRTLAVEWAARSIRMNVVVPSHVDTPMQRRLVLEGVVDADAVIAMNAMRRMATPAEIASVIVFLLGEEASFITGQTINADGGFNILKLTVPPE